MAARNGPLHADWLYTWRRRFGRRFLDVAFRPWQHLRTLPAFRRQRMHALAQGSPSLLSRRAAPYAPQAYPCAARAIAAPKHLTAWYRQRRAVAAGFSSDYRRWLARRRNKATTFHGAPSAAISASEAAGAINSAAASIGATALMRFDISAADRK